MNNTKKQKFLLKVMHPTAGVLYYSKTGSLTYTLADARVFASKTDWKRVGRNPIKWVKIKEASL